LKAIVALAASPPEIQGIVAGFVPSILRTNFSDEIITVNDQAINGASAAPRRRTLSRYFLGAVVVVALNWRPDRMQASWLHLSNVLFEQLRLQALGLSTFPVLA
jgi:cysteine synthase